MAECKPLEIAVSTFITVAELVTFADRIGLWPMAIMHDSRLPSLKCFTDSVLVFLTNGRFFLPPGKFFRWAFSVKKIVENFSHSLGRFFCYPGVFFRKKSCGVIFSATVQDFFGDIFWGIITGDILFPGYFYANSILSRGPAFIHGPQYSQSPVHTKYTLFIDQVRVSG